jgi:hypothetical protein
MSYRRNPTDKQQTDIERAEDDSSNRIAWFDGKMVQTGQVKAIPALDVDGQGNVGGLCTSAKRAIPNSGAVIGSHNDKPHRFETPGKA